MMDPQETPQLNERYKIHWGRFAVWAAVIAITLIFLTRIYHTLLIFGTGFLVAYLLSPAVKFFSNIQISRSGKKISWMASIIIVYVLLFALCTVAIVVLLPLAIDQVRNIVQDTPQLVGKAQAMLSRLQIRYEKMNISPEVEARLMDFINTSIARLGNTMGIVFKSIGKILGDIVWAFIFVIFALIIAMFTLANIESLKRQFYSYIPPNYQDDIRDLLVEINDIFGAYVRGYSVLCVINGCLTYAMLFVVLWILRLNPGFTDSFPIFGYALVVSVIAGITYFIPYIGCSSAVIVAMALAFLQVPTFVYVITVGLTALLTNQFVDRFITPKILGDALGVSTLFIVFAAFAGAEILGVWGMILGIPSAVMLQSIMRFIYKRFLAFPVSEKILAPVSNGPTHLEHIHSQTFRPSPVTEEKGHNKGNDTEHISQKKDDRK